MNEMKKFRRQFEMESEVYTTCLVHPKPLTVQTHIEEEDELSMNILIQPLLTQRSIYTTPQAIGTHPSTGQ